MTEQLPARTQQTGSRLGRARTHTGIERLEMLGTRTKLSAYGLWHYGKDFLALADPAAEKHFSPARYFVVARSIELFLKGYLSVKGMSLVDLSSPRFSHNLAVLFEQAQQVGLLEVAQLSPEQIEAIRLADRYYGEKVFEYPAVMETVHAYPHLPDFELLRSAAKVLCSNLEPLAKNA